MVSGHSSPQPAVTAHTGRTISLSGENNCAVCLRKGCHFLQPYEALPAFSLSRTSLSLFEHPENEPRTQVSSIIFFPPSPPVDFHLSAHLSLISLLSFTVLLLPPSLPLYPFASQELMISWVEVRVSQVVPGCLPSILAESDGEDRIREAVK